ncbi:hypothetical protein GYMLUDRAFT_102058, partial [Collybiopsis luxurians FD-317 M1]
SKSAANTVMLQGFNSRHITGRASGALCKEFRELKLLDKITKLHYNGKLDPSVKGSTCKSLIQEFVLWKGLSYVPQNIHVSIHWNKSNPLVLANKEDVLWTYLKKTQAKK